KGIDGVLQTIEASVGLAQLIVAGIGGVINLHRFADTDERLRIIAAVVIAYPLVIEGIGARGVRGDTASYGRGRRNRDRRWVCLPQRRVWRFAQRWTWRGHRLAAACHRERKISLWDG